MKIPPASAQGGARTGRGEGWEEPRNKYIPGNSETPAWVMISLVKGIPGRLHRGRSNVEFKVQRQSLNTKETVRKGNGGQGALKSQKNHAWQARKRVLQVENRD